MYLQATHLNGKKFKAFSFDRLNDMIYNYNRDNSDSYDNWSVSEIHNLHSELSTAMIASAGWPTIERDAKLVKKFDFGYSGMTSQDYDDGNHTFRLFLIDGEANSFVRCVA